MSVVFRGLRDAFRQPAFVACVVVLAGSAIGLQWAVSALGVRFRKLPIALRQPLANLETDLARRTRYRVRHKERLSAEAIGTLGTDQYIYWGVEDTSRRPDDPLKYLVLMITYYTGDPDQVPHVPDVCMTAQGYRVEEQSDDTVKLRAADGSVESVPLQALRFAKSTLMTEERPTVLYTFHANGDFWGSRTGVRLALGDPRSTHAYFSKVEVKIDLVRRTLSSSPSAPSGPTPEATVQASKALLRKVLPFLVADYWPREAELQGAMTND